MVLLNFTDSTTYNFKVKQMNTFLRHDQGKEYMSVVYGLSCCADCYIIGC